MSILLTLLLIILIVVLVQVIGEALGLGVVGRWALFFAVLLVLALSGAHF